MKPYLDKIGSFGSVVAAAACPVCFPKLALVGALFGLGALGSYESQIFLITKVLVLLAVAGQVLAYLQHRKLWLLALSVAGGAAFFLGLYAFGSEALVYAGFAALVLASVWDMMQRALQRRKLRLPSGGA